MSFTHDAWSQNAAAYEAIRTMPFNAALADGTLPQETFRHYIVQDAHYLVGFGRALTLAAAKAPSPERLIQFAEAGTEVLVEERALHAGYFAKWGIDADTFARTPVTPATHASIQPPARRRWSGMTSTPSGRAATSARARSARSLPAAARSGCARATGSSLPTD